MEIDVMLENYRVGFEFQGEHHYRDSSVIQKDREKLRIAKQNNHILIPVNIFQLNSIALQTLIANTMKDYLNIQELYSERRHSYNPAQLPNSRRLLQFCKVIQRLYLAKTIFAESLNWLDIEMASYIANVSTRSPISSSTQAPRQIPSTVELDLDEVYAGLKNITAARKVRKMMLE